jgi:hypothetical protein
MPDSDVDELVAGFVKEHKKQFSLFGKPQIPEDSIYI